MIYDKTLVSKSLDKELMMVAVKTAGELFDGSILTSAGNDVLQILLVARHRGQALYLLQPMGVTEAMMEGFIKQVMGKLKALQASAEGY